MDVFKEIFSTKGRLNRSLYVKYQLIWTLLIVLAGTTGAEMAEFITGATDMGANITATLFYIGLVGSFMLMARRLHDINLSGFFVLAVFVPVLGIFFWLYLLFAPGTVGANQYGKEPSTE